MKPEIEIGFRDVQIPNLASINYYVHNSLPIFTKFCMLLTNVVALTSIAVDIPEVVCRF